MWRKFFATLDQAPMFWVAVGLGFLIFSFFLESERRSKVEEKVRLRVDIIPIEYIRKYAHDFVGWCHPNAAYEFYRHFSGGRIEWISRFRGVCLGRDEGRMDKGLWKIVGREWKSMVGNISDKGHIPFP